MNPKQLLEEIIRPALSYLELGGRNVEALLLATSAVESECGFYVKQFGGGPALGIYQMEPATYVDLQENYLEYQRGYKSLLDGLLQRAYSWRQQLISDAFFATVAARLHYRRYPEAIPQADDVDGMWRLYKKRWNSSLGATERDDFMFKWLRYVHPTLAGDTSGFKTRGGF